jgi:hypothetical protein
VWTKNPKTGRRTPYRGRFIDVIASAAALDGLDTDSLEAHCEAFGVPSVELPAAIGLDALGAEAVVGSCDASWRLALALDREAAQW